MAKKLLTMVLVFCMLGMTAGATGVAPGTTQVPSTPSTFLVNETFEDKAGKIIGERAVDIFTPMSTYNSGGVINLNGNHVLSVYSNKNATSIRGWQVPVNISNFATPITSGYWVYEADVMLPNVAPEGAEKVAGGTAYLALNHFSTADNCPDAGKSEGELCPTFSSHSDPKNEHRGHSSGRVGIYMQEGKFGLITSKTQGTYYVNYPVKADTWYNIKFVVDMTNGTFDAYIDNRLAVTNFPFCLNNDALVSACVGALNIANTDITQGWLLGDGTTAAETKKYFGDPRATYYDNIKLYEITQNDAIAHTKAGFEACFDVSGIRENVMLPYPGNTKSTVPGVTQHGVSYSTAFETVSAFRLNTYASKNDLEEGFSFDKPREGLVERPGSGEADAVGTVTMHYVKGDVDFSHTVSITVPAACSLPEFPGVEIGDLVLQKTEKGAKAFVYAGNLSDSDFEATVIICSYEEGYKLSGIELYPLESKAGDSDTLSFSFEKDTAKDVKLKGFIWIWNRLKPISFGELSLQSD
ncbi:MAG: hypothetical protein PUB07_07280 [Clostridia bacterium]|nr:hypothetical protein [Clostridia bacterium]